MLPGRHRFGCPDNGLFWDPVAGQMPVDEDKVVATVDGFAIRMSDIDGVRPNLPLQAARYPESVVTNFPHHDAQGHSPRSR